MSQLDLNFLGSFQVTLDGRPLTVFESDKVRGLLAYLSVESNQAHNRTQLATLLWSGYSDESARTTLRHVLHRLRLTIGDESASPPFLLITRQTLQFNPALAQQVDVTRFTTLLRACTEHPHDQLATCQVCLARMQQAGELYRGDFLSDLAIHDSAPFEEWRRIRQEQFHVQALDTFHTLALASELRGENAQVLTYAQRQLVLEPWREEAHRQIMRALVRQGQRSAAIAQYQSCRRVLLAELGIEPDTQTTALYEQIRSGVLPTVAQEPLAKKSAVSLPAPVLVSDLRVSDLRVSDLLAPDSEDPLLSLPSSQPPFVGREEEVRQIVALLAQPSLRFLTLLGAGGIGKTRLALEVARRIGVARLLPQAHASDRAATQPTNRRFGDGVFFVPLASLERTTDLASAIANGVGLSSHLSDPKQALIQSLRHKELLLVLDNFEHLLEGAPLVAELLQASPNLCILVTSRNRLNLYGEQ